MIITTQEQKILNKHRRSDTHIDDLDDEQLEAMTWDAVSRLQGVTVVRYTIEKRTNREGMSRREAATTPRRRSNQYAAERGANTITRRAQAAGLSRKTVSTRIHAKGMTLEEALAMPVMDPAVQRLSASKKGRRRFKQ